MINSSLIRSFMIVICHSTATKQKQIHHLSSTGSNEPGTEQTAWRVHPIEDRSRLHDEECSAEECDGGQGADARVGWWRTGNGLQDAEGSQQVVDQLTLMFIHFLFTIVWLVNELVSNLIYFLFTISIANINQWSSFNLVFYLF